jgi:hypothetical protein
MGEVRSDRTASSVAPSLAENHLTVPRYNWSLIDRNAINSISTSTPKYRQRKDP